MYSVGRQLPPRQPRKPPGQDGGQRPLSEDVVGQFAEVEIEKQRGEERRKDVRLAQELVERNRFLLLTTLGFAATLVLIALSVVTGQPLAYAGSGVGLILSGGGLYRLEALTSPARRHGEEEGRTRGRGAP